MGRVTEIAQKVLIWSYERGSLQYDIICALILAFIFLVPPSCFHKKQGAPQGPRSYAQGTGAAVPGTPARPSLSGLEK